mmetsp:Transcript_9704/g.17669  ORF Transcript_9704/g.17669 Transcript_9704/m.17669 type:complete len:318 (-) Transcript_9704:47-1000(-)
MELRRRLLPLLMTISFFCVFYYVLQAHFPALLESVAVLRTTLNVENVTAGPESNPDKDFTPVKIYSNARPDRSGAFLQDMLFAHAYAFSKNYTYGGCCESGEPATYRNDVQKLIDVLGLQNVLRFACPGPSDESAQIVDRLVYYNQDTGVWTHQWLSHMQNLVHYNTSMPPLPMAIHIRRGDVDVCDTDNGFRYLPNSHYLRLIDMYRPSPNTPVHIFSETTSSESWDDFRRDENIFLELDAPIEKVYVALATAEILVMSKSSFSLNVGMLNNHQVIYTPFWHKPLQHWNIVSPEIMSETNFEMLRLKEKMGCLNNR